MKVEPQWEEFYKKTSLDKIPWNNTQADYFQQLLDSNKLGARSALDLGCGVGAKSITLVKRGFEVTGVDIVKTAIECARAKAKEADVQVNFIAADATDLSFLKNKKFDLVLDWACLPGIPKAKRKKYVDGIARHTKKNGKFLLRCFSKHGVNKEFAFSLGGRIYLFSRQDIESLFGNYFKILETNRSKPFSWQPPGKWLDEYLMEKF